MHKNTYFVSHTGTRQNKGVGKQGTEGVFEPDWNDVCDVPHTGHMRNVYKTLVKSLKGRDG
jgi:hypothetical protein